MKHKKWFGILAALLALALALTGCQSGTSPSGSDSQSASGSSSQGESQELEYVELEYYLAEKEPTDAAMVWDAINEYLVEKINAKVNIHWIEHADYNQRMAAITGAGQTLDLMFTSTGNFNFPTNAHNGAFLALDDLLPEYAPELLEEVPEYVLEGGRVDGKIYAIPSYKDVADVFALIWNDTLAQDVGMDEEKLTASWSYYPDLDELLREFKALRDEKYPENADVPMMTAYPTTGAWWSWDQIIGGVCTNVGGIEYFADQGSGEKVFNAYATPEYLEIVKQVRTWVEDGILPEANSNFDPDGTLQRTGLVPIKMGNGLVAIGEHFYSEDWVSKLNRSEVAVTYTNYLQAAATAVSQNSPNPERTVMFINLMYTDEYIATTSRFGLEGEHYTVVQDSEGNDRLDFSEGRNSDPTNRGFYFWYGYQWGNLFKSKLPIEEPDNLYDELMEMNDDAGQYETNLGFVFDQEPVANEIAACSNVYDEYANPLMQGAFADVETTVAEFNQKLEANGIQKIIDEAQKQLNEWRAANGKPVYEG